MATVISKKVTNMSTRAVSTYDNVSESQSQIDGPVGGPPIFRASIQRRFRGGLTGESVAEALICTGTPDGIGYVATDRFSGRLDGRSGSFVFQHGGTIEGGALRPFGYVVPGSGTGELRGLRGDVTISVSTAGEHTLTLEYHLA